MKKPTLKIKRPSMNISKKMPYIFIVIFLVVGLSVVYYSYTLLKREPEEAVIKQARQEIDDLKIKFSKSKSEKLFDSNYDTSNIKNPGYKTKNPFQDL